MDQLLTTREDFLTVQGYTELDDYRNELDVLTNTLILLVRKTIATIKSPKAIKLVEGIASQIDSWIFEMDRGQNQLEIKCTSKSAEVDQILTADMADSLELLTTSSEKYKIFQQCRKDGLAVLRQGILDIQQKVAPKSSGTKSIPDTQDIPVEIQPTISVNPADDQEYYTTQQLCEKLQVTERCMANWRANGKIAFTKIGRKIIYSSSQVNDLIARHYRKRRPW